MDNNEYLLTLTREEVITLRNMLNRIGGDPWKSPRQWADTIRHKLDEFDLPYQPLDMRGEHPGFYFDDFKEGDPLGKYLLPEGVHDSYSGSRRAKVVPLGPGERRIHIRKDKNEKKE
jgi:hypothetical protein